MPTVSVGTFKRKVPKIDIVVSITDSDTNRSKSGRRKSGRSSEKDALGVVDRDSKDSAVTAEEYLKARKPQYLRDDVPLLSQREME